MKTSVLNVVLVYKVGQDTALALKKLTSSPSDHYGFFKDLKYLG